MGIRRIGWAAAWMVIGLSGCGDHNNFFGSLADDNSIEAKIEEAQIALDNGDCQKAINGFTAAFNHDPNNVGIRVNLAAAYTCRAGFNIPAMIRVVADFTASKKTADQFDLFKAIADAAVELVSDSYKEDTDAAIGFLTDASLPPKTDCTPPPFAYNLDAAFNYTIVATVRAVMAVTELKNDAGVIITGNITQDVATNIGSALRDADNGITCAKAIGDSAIVDSDIAQAISELNDALNKTPDNDPDDDPTVQELKDFLKAQGFDVP